MSTPSAKKKDILTVLADAARERTRNDQQTLSLEQLKISVQKLVESETCENHPPFAFEKALRKPGLSVIAEAKKASPSKGLIDPVFDYLSIAREYEKAGADCMSVLTEPTRFLGSDQYLKEISQAVSLPLLRKDFIIDPYMIWQAKFLGASAILLIVSLLRDEQLKDWIELASSLHMDALVECHDENEIQRAVQAGARIIGVNNRNLKNFTVDPENAKKLSASVPEDILFVSESGAKSAEDLEAAATFADGILIGEALMRAENKTEKLAELKSRLNSQSADDQSQQNPQNASAKPPKHGSKNENENEREKEIYER